MQSSSGQYASRRGNSTAAESTIRQNSRSDIGSLKAQLTSMRHGNPEQQGQGLPSSGSGIPSLPTSTNPRSDIVPQTSLTEIQVNQGLQMKMDLAEDKSLTVLVRSISRFIADTNGPTLDDLMLHLDSFTARDSWVGSHAKHFGGTCHINESFDAARSSLLTDDRIESVVYDQTRLDRMRIAVKAARCKRNGLTHCESMARILARKRDRSVLNRETHDSEVLLGRLSSKRDLVVSHARKHHKRIGDILACFEALGTLSE